jgi:VanZ family protein
MISFKRWIPSLLVMVLIFYFSSTPASKVSQLSAPGIEQVNQIISQITGTPVQEIGIDWLKVGHIIGYAALGGSFYFALVQYPRVKEPLLLALFFCFAYALTDEFHQLFVSGRCSEFSDVLLDSIAAGVVLLLIKWIGQAKNRNKPSINSN